MISSAGTGFTHAVRSSPGRTGSLLLVGLGGTVGTLVRFLLESAIPAAPGTWPWTTICINVTGALVLAVLLETLTVLGQDDGWRRGVRLGVGTGVLGGYTTYSTFMVESATISQSGAYLMAFAYIATSLVLGFIAAWAGMAGVAALHRRRSGTPR
ncbi:fluoride efflux transporter FluC [Tessaracoccus sp.]